MERTNAALAGKVVVVTGVGREGQVGEMVAARLADGGASLLLLDRLADEVQARAAAIREHGASVDARMCDLTDPADVERAAGWIAERTDGRVDALVNLAGGFAASGAVAESDPAGWDRQLAINLATAYLTSRFVLPLMRPHGGSVVYFASEAALPSGKAANMFAYAAAKSGVVALMRAVAQEERGNAIRANALAPTAIRTASNIATMGEKVRYVEREEVADVVAFLCSDAARAITGQVIALT